MKSARQILGEVLALPTAPFSEQYVIQYIERFCSLRDNLTLKHDRAGNVLVHVKVGKPKIKRPVCITAHLDHPGFVADRMVNRKTVRAFWRGGVPKQYFVGSGARFYLAGEWTRGRIHSIKSAIKLGVEKVHTADIAVDHTIPSGTIGMWDFPDPVIRGSKIYARGCDDLAGAAAMLSAIDQLCEPGGLSQNEELIRPNPNPERKRRANRTIPNESTLPCEVYFLFTRAEEVGFIGAIAACRAKTIPKNCVVVAMETSSERPFAKIGDGPILRVGDKATTFTHAATVHCQHVAQELGKADKSFKFQRKLMDGGTCESSAYSALGYEATGMCVALGNYHNIDAKRKKLGPEYIDLNDYENTVKWFVALARSTRGYTGRDEAIQKQLIELERYWGHML